MSNRLYSCAAQEEIRESFPLRPRPSADPVLCSVTGRVRGEAMEADDATLLRQQLAYYQARAAEYDQWWLREGRYDRGPEANAQWRKEGQEVSAALTDFAPGGRVLELACGTGLWSGQLVESASGFTAVDGSPEMLAIHAGRLPDPAIRRIRADLFSWQPDAVYDHVFFSFWLSHVPPGRFAAFWQMVRSCLAPGGRVFFVDSRHEPTSTAADHTLPEPQATRLQRRLNDGREFQICKVFYDRESLTTQLAALGWESVIRQTDRYFLYGEVRPF